MPCACGCGEEVRPGKTYRHGHWLRDHPLPPRKHLTPEHREKIRQSSKAFGPRPRTPEHNRKIADAKRGKPNPHSPEWRAKVSAAKRGKKRKPFSEEWKEKIRQSSKAFGPRPRTPEHQAKINAAMRRLAQEPSWWAKQRNHLARVRPTRKPSGLEMLVARLLDAEGIAYIQQASLGWYHVDFLLPDKSIVLECDGKFWHSTPKAQRDDARRDAWLMRHGYTVLRLKEEDIRSDTRRIVLQSLRSFI